MSPLALVSAGMAEMRSVRLPRGWATSMERDGPSFLGCPSVQHNAVTS
jgi:hypothetical protein